MDSKNPPTSSAASKSPIAAAALVEWTNRLNADTFVPWHLQQPANASLGNGPSVNGTAANGTAANGTTVNGTAANEEFFDDEIVGFVTVKLPIYRSHRSLTAVYVHPYEPKEPELIPKEVEVLPGKFAPPLELPEEVIGTFRPVSGEKTLTRAVSFFTAPYEMDQENWEISNVVIHHTMPSFCGCGHVEPSEFHHANFAKAIDEEKNRPMEEHDTNSVQNPSAEVPVQPDATQETPILGDSSRKKQPDEPPAKVLKKDQLDALFSEGDSITLPGFGRVTRSEVEQNMERYSEAIFQEQDVVFASMQNKEASTKASEEEGFQTVTKRNSFNPAKLTENQQEALKKAMQEARQEQHAAQVKAKAVSIRPDVISEQPCSSNKPTSSANSGASTPRSAKKSKSGKMKSGDKKKTVEVVDKDMKDLDDATLYNMAIMLDAYYERRRELLANKASLEDYENESEDYKFDKMLVNCANNFPTTITVADREMKNATCGIIIAQLSAMKVTDFITEERRKELITFYNFLDTRNDDILVIDMATLEMMIMNNEDETATYLWLYCSVCYHHTLITSRHDASQSTPRVNNSEDNLEEDLEDESEDSSENEERYQNAITNMKNRIDAYYEMRQRMREQNFNPPRATNESTQVQLERALIEKANSFTGTVSDKEKRRSAIFVDVFLAQMDEIGFEKTSQTSFRVFFQHIVARAFDIFAIDAIFLNEMRTSLPKDDFKSAIITYFRIFLLSQINLPTDP